MDCGKWRCDQVVWQYLLQAKHKAMSIGSNRLCIFIFLLASYSAYFSSVPPLCAWKINQQGFQKTRKTLWSITSYSTKTHLEKICKKSPTLPINLSKELQLCECTMLQIAEAVAVALYSAQISSAKELPVSHEVVPKAQAHCRTYRGGPKSKKRHYWELPTVLGASAEVHRNTMRYHVNFSVEWKIKFIQQVSCDDQF